MYVFSLLPFILMAKKYFYVYVLIFLFCKHYGLHCWEKKDERPIYNNDGQAR